MAKKLGKLLGVLFHTYAWGKTHEMIRVLAATEKGVRQGRESLRPSNRRKVDLKSI